MSESVGGGKARPAPVERRVDVFAANAADGTYWPCGREEAVTDGEVCVEASAADEASLQRLAQKMARHRRWVRVEGSVLSPNDGRAPRPIDVLSPTWSDTGMSGYWGAIDYHVALRDVPLETTHVQTCRYVAAPYTVDAPTFSVERAQLCRGVHNPDTRAWWQFWRQVPRTPATLQQEGDGDPR